jgi:creatinine amidohydrolase/Fe(II)-dependent formamide hydrolase-like protein
MRDFREVAGVGWYGTPDAITEERAREIIDAVAEHIVSAVEEVWKGLGEQAAREGKHS